MYESIHRGAAGFSLQQQKKHLSDRRISYFNWKILLFPPLRNADLSQRGEWIEKLFSHTEQPAASSSFSSRNSNSSRSSMMRLPRV